KRHDQRLDRVTRDLVAEMLLVGGLCQTQHDAKMRVDAAITSGRAAETFARMVAALGGPADLLDCPSKYLAAAPVVTARTPASEGRIAMLDTRAIGVALIELGGGRLSAQGKIDHRVGFSEFAGVGTFVGPDQPICLIHAADTNAWARAAEAVRAAVRIN